MTESVAKDNKYYLNIVNQLRALTKEEMEKISNFSTRYEKVIIELIPAFKKIIILNNSLSKKHSQNDDEKYQKASKAVERQIKNILQTLLFLMPENNTDLEIKSTKSGLFPGKNILDYNGLFKVPLSTLFSLSETNISDHNEELANMFEEFENNVVELKKIISIFDTASARIQNVLRHMRSLHQIELSKIRTLIEMFNETETRTLVFWEGVSRNIHELENRIREEKEEVIDVLKPILTLEYDAENKLLFILHKMERPNSKKIFSEYLNTIRRCSNEREVKDVNDKVRNYLIKNRNLSTRFVNSFIRYIDRVSFKNSVAIKNLKERVKQGDKDSLTGLRQRRTFLNVLNDWISIYTHRRTFSIDTVVSSSKICICMIDIDHFKDFNDLYSHLVGDKVLIKTVRLFTECKIFRDEDLINFFRWGGEEFILLTRGIEKKEVYERLIKIKEIIEENTKEMCHEIGLNAKKEYEAKITGYFGSSMYVEDYQIQSSMTSFIDSDFSHLSDIEIEKRKDQIIEDLKNKNASLEIIDIFNKLVRVKRRLDKNISITISGGVCEYELGMSVDAFIKKVDALLYEAKAKGRNRIVCDRLM